MLLAIDVGNTNVVIAIFKGERVIESWRLHSSLDYTPDEWWIAVKLLAEDAEVGIDKLAGICVASVVPSIGHAIVEMCERYLRHSPLRVHAHLPLDLGLNVTHPESVGADRICNVVAGREIYGTPCVIVDLGTATTYDIVDETGRFIGGSIAPGIDTSARQLTDKAALLAGVELKVPDTVIGKDTETNLQAGIVFGAVDQIDGMLERIREETGWKRHRIILTGGLGAFVSDLLKTENFYDPNLTISGLRLIYEQCSRR